jgi:hypothetical protein
VGWVHSIFNVKGPKHIFIKINDSIFSGLVEMIIRGAGWLPTKVFSFSFKNKKFNLSLILFSFFA